MAWIFQDIQTIKDNILYKDKGTPLEVKMKRYNEELRAKINPELYARYLINSFDVYLDAMMVIVSVQNVFPSVSEENITSWIYKYKGEHNIIVW